MLTFHYDSQQFHLFYVDKIPFIWLTVLKVQKFGSNHHFALLRAMRWMASQWHKPKARKNDQLDRKPENKERPFL